VIEIADVGTSKILKTYKFGPSKTLIVNGGDIITAGDPIAEGKFINNIFYTDMARLFLVELFAFLCFLVYRATVLRERQSKQST
jgi:hypothetical protein